tara:strand:- start:266 stop:703 length:438 start_codon:yes stop_codon:yes gene_type:complete
MVLRLKSLIPHADKINPAISAREVGWHLEHSLKIICSICKTLVNSRPENYASSFNVVKYYILWSKRIPRGKVRSPKHFNNKQAINIPGLHKLLKDAVSALADLENLHPKQHFRHPLFGDLNLSQGKKFILIHTNHHLDIADEILA